MIDFKEVADGEQWELFARDYLQAMGLFVETPPNRGPDLGRDLLVSETLGGRLGRLRMTWLVSCKHFANNKKGPAVSESDEQNLLERIKGFKTDGFIGVYSTIGSSGLIGRLEQLRTNGDIKDYRVLDHREIENRLVTAGYSTLLMRFFPKSYGRIKPIHFVASEYLALECEICGKDLLEALLVEKQPGNILILQEVRQFDAATPMRIHRVMAACKNPCDQIAEDRFRQDGMIMAWLSISDIVIPHEYLRRFFAYMNHLERGSIVFVGDSFRELKHVFIALAQKVMRRMTEEELNRLNLLAQLPDL